ncbi:MAG: ATP-binding protein [Planctomycetota bacterium]|jgi:PAS domain S-box-containing protein
MKYLVFLSGPRKGHRVRVDREALSMGRDRENDVPLDDVNASRNHAEVFLREGSYHIRDLHSTNGTFLNGARVEESALKPGDRISIGEVMLVFEDQPTKKGTHVVKFSELPEEKEPDTLRLDPKDSQFLDPRAVLDRPAAAERLTQLYQFISAVAPILTIERLLAEVLDRALGAVRADRGFIMLADERGGLQPAMMRLRDPSVGAGEIQVSRRMTEQVLDTGQSILSSDTLHDRRFKDSDVFTGSRVSSFVCVPLKSQDKMRGLLYLDTVGSTPPLDEQALEFLTAMGLLAGAFFANARLYGDLMDSADEMRSILRCLRSGVVVTDLDGKVLQVNDSACEFIGLHESDLLQSNFAELGALRPLWRVMDETRRSGIPADSRDLFVTVAGEEVPVGATTSLLRDHENHVRGIVAIFRDLSVINKLRQQVQMSEHLAAIGKMAAGVAHEVRNPLNAIRGFAQLVEEMLPEAGGTEAADSGRDYTKIIIEEVDRMDRLVQDLLDLSRQRELTMTAMEPGVLVEDVLREMAPEIDGNRVEVRTDIEPGLPQVMGSTAKMKQVLVNIVQNAIQAMTPPVAPEDKPRRLTASVRAVGSEGGAPAAVEVAFSDTGMGMDRKTRAHAFEPFVTTRERGTGLGLAICRKIIQQHDGEITADSEAGAGSTFRITLPAK